jgi:DNA polymerase (family 10)
MAKEAGVKIAISTDAHSPSQFGYMRFGIDQARRGWLEAKDVVNTHPLREVRALFKR